jgi:hypothetical protein
MAIFSTANLLCLVGLHGESRVILPRPKADAGDASLLMGSINYTRLDPALSLLLREVLIQAYTAHEPTYSPGAGITRNEISSRALQNHLLVNEAILFKVTVLMG